MDDSGEVPQTESAIDRLERLRSESAGHRVVSIPLLKGSGHLVVDHLLVQEIFKSQDFVRPPFFRKAFGDGLLLSDGERWAHSRKVIQPELSPTAVRSMQDVIDDCIKELQTDWSRASEEDRSVPLVADIASCVLRITVRVLFGVDLGAPDPRALSVVRLTAASNELAGLGVFDPRAMVGGRLINALQKERTDVESLAAELIASRRDAPDAGACPVDLLDHLLDPAFIEAPVADGGCPVGHKGLIEEMVLLLLASVETTTASTSNTLQLLADHPACTERLREDLPDGTWVQACFRESLRLRPPVWFNGRVALERFELSSGDTIESGDHVYVCPYLIHRDPLLWEEPDRFLPERFIDGVVREGASFMPFGLGRHYCVGSGLATAISTSLVSSILANHDVSIEVSSDHEPGGGFLLGPSLGSRARITPTSRPG